MQISNHHIMTVGAPKKHEMSNVELQIRFKVTQTAGKVIANIEPGTKKIRFQNASSYVSKDININIPNCSSS